MAKVWAASTELKLFGLRDVLVPLCMCVCECMDCARCMCDVCVCVLWSVCLCVEYVSAWPVCVRECVVRVYVMVLCVVCVCVLCVAVCGPQGTARL